MNVKDIKEGHNYVVEHVHLHPRFNANVKVIMKVTHLDMHANAVGPGIRMENADFGQQTQIGNISIPLSILKEAKEVDETNYTKAMKIYNMFSHTYTSFIDNLLVEDETDKDNKQIKL